MKAEWLARYRFVRFQVLFALLITTIVVQPVLHTIGLSGRLLDAFLVASLLAAGFGGLGLGRGIAILVLVLLFVASRLLAVTRDAAGIATTASDAAVALASVLAAIAALREALRDGPVTRERLYAAIDVYLLAGVAFGLTYHGLSRMQPGALVAAGSTVPLGIETAIYFSFVTLATLGYGDVVPATPIARSLAICEAVGAQLFVAVLIARLVSLQSRSRP